MNMNNINARARLQALFVQYHCLLIKHVLKWILKGNQKLDVTHVPSKIRPLSLKDRLQSDLDFSHHETKRDFTDFLNHALKVSKALKIVESGQRRTKTDPYYRPCRSGNHNQTNSSEDLRDPKYEIPLCLCPPQKAKGLRKLLKICRDCPLDEKRRILAERVAEQSKYGPHSNARSKQSVITPSIPVSYTHLTLPTIPLV